MAIEGGDKYELRSQTPTPPLPPPGGWPAPAPAWQSLPPAPLPPPPDDLHIPDKRSRWNVVGRIVVGFVLIAVVPGVVNGIRGGDDDDSVSSVEDLAIGDCVDDLNAPIPEKVNCSQPHDGEVYFTPTASADQVGNDAHLSAMKACISGFGVYEGAPLVRSKYPRPNVFGRTTAAGDTQFVCVLNDLPNKLTGSQRNSEHVSSEGLVQRALNELHVGDCYGTTPDDFRMRFAVDIVSCDKTHYREVAGTFHYDDGSFPGDAALVSIAQERCGEFFEPYVGSSFENSALDLLIFYPAAETWDMGDRDGLCVLGGPPPDDNEPLIGSMKGRGI